MGKDVLKVTPLLRAKIGNTVHSLEIGITKMKGAANMYKRIMPDNDVGRRLIAEEEKEIKRAQELLKYWRQVLKRTA